MRFEDDSNDPIDLQLYQSHLNEQMNVEELPFRSHLLKVLHSTEIDTHNWMKIPEKVKLKSALWEKEKFNLTEKKIREINFLFSNFFKQTVTYNW